MIRSYLLLGAMTLLANGPAFPAVSALYGRITALPSSPPPSPSPASSARQVLTADQDSDGLFRLTGTVHRQRVDFIVDTGASATVLSGHDARRLGLLDGPVSAGVLRTAGGAVGMAWRHLDRLDIADRHLADLRVVVMKAGPAHSLLGQDVLARLGSITIDGNRLEIRPRRS